MPYRSLSHVINESRTISDQRVTNLTGYINNIERENISDKLGTSTVNLKSFFQTQTLQKLDPSFTLTESIVSGAENSTQLTMTKHIVSAFTIDENDDPDSAHHNLMVAILLGIFTCISLTIAISILVFCRKKNTVFMLQKCEQDSDLEMNDINTDVETSESEYEFIESTSPLTSRRKSQSFPNLSKYAEEIVLSSEEIQPINYENCSENRQTTNRHSSINRNKDQMSRSPTSTPLLKSSTSLSQTGVKHKPRHANFPRTLAKHSLSLNFVTDADSSSRDHPVCNTSHQKSSSRSRSGHKSRSGDKNNIPPKSNSKYAGAIKSKEHVRPKVSKVHISKKTLSPKRVPDAEDGFFEVHSSNSKCENENKPSISSSSHKKSNSSILRMESLDSDAYHKTVTDISDLSDLEDNSTENSEWESKLEML